MLTYTREQLATVVAVPIVSILLVWTIAIFHKNRKHWDPYDIPIVAIMIVSVIRNLTVLSYTLIVILNNQHNVDVEYCSVIVWIFNSVHTFQASSLTTLAVIGMFAAKLYRKRENLNRFLTATHVVYHLFCLTTLCACVGVAAILAQHDAHHHHFIRNPTCRFMPFQLDVKFNVFIIVLHIFLAIVSVASFLVICYHLYKAKMANFDYIKKSTSDLSELSYYDTYRLPSSSYYEQSDFSNVSTTVSSTNSRRPCLKQSPRRTVSEEESRTGLETIHPILVVCYLFYHLPLIVSNRIENDWGNICFVTLSRQWASARARLLTFTFQGINKIKCYTLVLVLFYFVDAIPKSMWKKWKLINHHSHSFVLNSSFVIFI